MFARKLMMNKSLAMTMQASAKTSLLFNPIMRAYHENVIDHYEKPRNVGSLDAKDFSVGTGLVGAPACGDVMRLQIKVNKESNKIEKAVFKVSLHLTRILQSLEIKCP